jgi:hypothetical protein
VARKNPIGLTFGEKAARINEKSKAFGQKLG